jgi:hypothetical protein
MYDAVQVVRSWMYLIGTAPRAKHLLNELWRLDGHKHRGCGGAVKRRVCERCQRPLARIAIRIDDPLPGPEAVMFNEYVVEKMYADPFFRPALDAWDQQLITKQDIKRFAEAVERGEYRGEAFNPYMYEMDKRYEDSLVVPALAA